ncbi:hypothetical protein DIPPA_09966 [Diplonema papillatum]|nr:hypothetical protein DIPPA_09966 [Diplonema papillatum]
MYSAQQQLEQQRQRAAQMQANAEEEERRRWREDRTSYGYAPARGSHPYQQASGLGEAFPGYSPAGDAAYGNSYPHGATSEMERGSYATPGPHRHERSSQRGRGNRHTATTPRVLRTTQQVVPEQLVVWGF